MIQCQSNWMNIQWAKIQGKDKEDVIQAEH